MLNRVMTALVVASIGLVVAGAWVLANRPIKTLVIEGELSAAERQSIGETLAAHAPGGLLDVDLALIQARLQSLSWAHAVGVRRAWPDRLTVTVSKLRPVARWADGGYISAQGALLELPDVHQDLPLFDIRLSSPQEAMEVFRLLDQIASREGLSVETLKEDGQGEWALVLDDGTEVLLGGEQHSERMHRILFAYRQALADEARRVEYIDARYFSGVAVKYFDPKVDQEPSNLTASVSSGTSRSHGR